MRTKNIYYTGSKSFSDFVQEEKFYAEPTVLVQVFSAKLESEDLVEISENILKTLPQAKIIGATTDGEILENVVSTNKVLVSITAFEHASLTLALEEGTDSYACGVALAQKLMTAQTKVMILFTAGLTMNGEAFLKGVETLSADAAIAGGMAGDAGKFKQTYVFSDEGVLSAGAVGVSINSESLYVKTNYSFNWQAIGKVLTVEKADCNRVYQIDGQTPVEIYAKYLGKEVAESLPAVGIEFPLIIKRNGVTIARAVLGKNEDGSLIFAGNISVGDKVQFGYGNSSMILNESMKLKEVFEEEAVESIFVYSCMARRRFLERSISFELAPLAELAPTAGFFTYGEFYKEKSCELLNQTMTVLAMSETKVPANYHNDIANNKNNIVKPSLTHKALSNLIMATSQEVEDLNTHLSEKLEAMLHEYESAQKVLVQQSKMAAMGEMLASITHQWKQPISSMKSAALNIKVKKELGTIEIEDYEKTFFELDKQVDFMTDTMDDFKNFLRPDKEMKSFRLGQGLEEIFELFAVQYETIGLYLKEYEHKKIRVKGFYNEYRQVVLNIINNARDAYSEMNIKDKPIYIHKYIENNMGVIEIMDKAGGIPENVIEKIFDQYMSTKDLNEGTGIGLYMSKSIIEENMNGCLTAFNRDGGAVFCIKLPLA